MSPTARTVLRVAAGIALAIAGGLATFALWFVGGVEFTGCFIKCTSDPNPLGGTLLIAASVAVGALSVSAAVWGAIGWNRPVLTKVATATAVLALIVALAGLSAF